MDTQTKADETARSVSIEIAAMAEMGILMTGGAVDLREMATIEVIEGPPTEGMTGTIDDHQSEMYVQGNAQEAHSVWIKGNRGRMNALRIDMGEMIVDRGKTIRLIRAVAMIAGRVRGAVETIAEGRMGDRLQIGSETSLLRLLGIVTIVTLVTLVERTLNKSQPKEERNQEGVQVMLLPKRQINEKQRNTSPAIKNRKSLRRRVRSPRRQSDEQAPPRIAVAATVRHPLLREKQLESHINNAYILVFLTYF